jgi:hypothetical protein
VRRAIKNDPLQQKKKWGWNPQEERRLNQIHSLHSSHLHQLHISQSDIAPLPNVYWMVPNGEACDQSITITVKHPCKNGNSITRLQKMELDFSERHHPINKIPSLDPSHSHQLHIPQSDIVPRSNVLPVMQSGVA